MHLFASCSKLRFIVIVPAMLAAARMAAEAPVPSESAAAFAADVAPYLSAEAVKGQPPVGLDSSHAMIAGATNPLAVHAGYEVLRRGGTAVDAALTTALAQVALNDGANVSYAGVLVAVGFDAATKRVYSLNAAYNTVRGETSSLTIPVEERSGRMVLVPGFMAGVQALHDRFGKLPFPDLFAPAIWVAEHGVPFDNILADALRSQAKIVTRTPEGARIFKKPDGSLYRAGELFRQPDLAATLRAVAREGAGYMYHGPWARHCVDQVQAAGGKLALEDLENYRALWSEPARTTYHGFAVAGVGPPNLGSEIQIDALTIAEVADLRRFGKPSQPEALYYRVQIRRAAEAEVHNRAHRPGDLIDAGLAQRLWDRIARNETRHDQAPVMTPHTTSVVAIDPQGNVVVLLHTINTFAWGTTGIFVDGVSIPDSARIQRDAVAKAGPGSRLPDPGCPLLVLHGGKPVLASAATGYAIPAVMFGHVLDFVDSATKPLPSLQMPYPRGRRVHPATRAEAQEEVFGEGDLSTATIERLRAQGLSIAIGRRLEQASEWVGIAIDASSGTLSGAASRGINGSVEGF